MTGNSQVENEVLASFGLLADYGQSLSLYLNFAATHADEQTSRLLSGGIIWSF